jgi:lysophospholipase L1-like esterase
MLGLDPKWIWRSLLMKMKKLSFIIAILTFIATILLGGILILTDSFLEGNSSKYNPDKVEQASDSLLKGRSIIFLGSSVTRGVGLKGVSFVDFLEAKHSIAAYKEAVSGTTLVDSSDKSYIKRMEANLSPDIKADLFACQLSTNDATQGHPLGFASDSHSLEDFDVATICGAIEYIICYAQATWNCPVVFYTAIKFDSELYAEMVPLLYELQSKWEKLYIIDLWNNETLNSIDGKSFRLYAKDPIHPTKAGYLEWWLPEIEKGLVQALAP